jgi:hypothetical protein
MAQRVPTENNVTDSYRPSPSQTHVRFSCFNIYILHFIVYCYPCIISVLPQTLFYFQFIRIQFLTSQVVCFWGWAVILYAFYNKIFVKFFDPKSAMQLWTFNFYFYFSYHRDDCRVLADNVAGCIWKTKVVFDTSTLYLLLCCKHKSDESTWDLWNFTVFSSDFFVAVLRNLRPFVTPVSDICVERIELWQVLNVSLYIRFLCVLYHFR